MARFVYASTLRKDEILPMKLQRTFLAIAIGVATLTGIASASSMSGDMMMSHGKLLPNVTISPSRFSGPGVYTGAPALPVTLSMIVAGGGPAHFSSLALVKRLAGAKTGAEVASLNKKFGAKKVATFLRVFNFVVADSLRIVTAKHIALPKTPSPNPNDGKALAGALWAAGQTGRGFNVEVMLDRAVSHPIHLQVMKDIDAKFGIAADADYHAVLTQAMHDLAAVYHFNAMGRSGSM